MKITSLLLFGLVGQIFSAPFCTAGAGASPLAKHLGSQIDSRLAGGASTAIFSRLNDATATYVRGNAAQFWAAGVVGLSAVSVYAEGGRGSSSIGGYVLVAPDIVLSCNHFGANDGDTYRFVSEDGKNTVWTATAGTKAAHAFQAVYDGGFQTDILVIRLISPAPAGFHPLKLLPAHWATTYLADYLRGPGVPLMVGTQDRQFIVDEMAQTGFGVMRANGNFWAFLHFAPRAAPRAAYHTSAAGHAGLRAGDSGYPVAFIVNGEMVLIGSNFTPTGTVDDASYIPAIDTAIAATGSASTVTTCDLAGFAR